MKKIITGILAGILTLAMTTVAFAAVTFDASTGEGFVGKGDVQTVLGLNNAQMQAQAGDLKFNYKVIESYSITLEKEVEVGKDKEIKTITKYRDISQQVKGKVEYESRTNKRQVTGFNLEGFDGTVVVTGNIPALGEEVDELGLPLPINGKSGWYVTEVELTETTGGLYVNGVALQ